MGQIAIFGGSFDPVHKAHIAMARLALKNLDLEKVIFVIAFSPPHKSRPLTPAKHRIKMLQLAVQNLNKVEISLYEISQRRIVYTWQTLNYFQKVYPKDKIFMLIGADSLETLPTWKNINEIAQQYKFIVVQRAGAAKIGESEFLDRSFIIKERAEDMSSTQIREMFLEGKNPSGFLDETVYKYIKENKLYGYKESS